MSKLATVITGASSGIGAALAPWFAAEKRNDLVLVARTEAPMQALADKLRKAHGVTVHVLTADLAKPGAAAKLHKAIEALGLSVDTLINNAGYGMTGHFVTQDIARVSQMMQLNMTALTELTYAVLPSMRSRQRGRIMNVSSIAAFQPCPNFASYGATKAYVKSFSEALAIELENDGIVVTTVCPGSTATEFHNVAGSTSAWVSRFTDTAETVAKEAYNALTNNQGVIVTGLMNKSLPMATRLMPRQWMARITSMLMAPDH